MDHWKVLQERYPATIELRDGREVQIRPIRAEDEQGLLAFFKKIPLEERRLYRHDVTDPEMIRRWCTKINIHNNIALLALHEGRIVADMTIHRSKLRASRHVALFRITVDRNYWGRGLGQAMVSHLIDLGPDLGISCLDAEVLPQQKAIMSLLEGLDFVNVGTLPQHVCDVQGRFHDVILMSMMAATPGMVGAEQLEGIDIGGND